MVVTVRERELRSQIVLNLMKLEGISEKKAHRIYRHVVEGQVKGQHDKYQYSSMI